MDVDNEEKTPEIENNDTSNGQNGSVPNSKSKKTKKSRKRKLSETLENDVPKSDVPKKKRKRGWSECEELLFRNGLEIYGRDWNKLALHVGNNRNAASIRSHAQVYFLKLLKEKKALPDKVLETGNGYTLGGAPLNKYSSIAVRHFGGADNVPMIDGVVSDKEAAEKSKRKPKNNKNDKNDDKNDNKNDTTKPKPKKKKKKRKKNKYYDSTDDEEETYQYDTSITSSTTKRRSGRSCTRNKRMCDALHITDPYGLRTDIEYYDEFISPTDPSFKSSKYSSSSAIHQPFEIKYCPNSLLIADIHSHLCLNVEIMGLLGGHYDIDNRILYILKCYPLREEEQGEQSVSADPSHHLSIIEKMRDIDNLQLIGWYHSHPCFDNYPSNTDCHQHAMHKFDDELINPYIGLIISSWSTNNIISGKSEYRFFNSIKEYDLNYTPLQFRTNTKVKKDINNQQLLQEIKELINVYSSTEYDIYRSNLGEKWNQQTNISREEKILKSIRGHAQYHHDDEDEDEDEDQDDDQIEIFIKKIHSLFMEKSDSWWVTNKPNKENTNSSNL